MQIAIVLDDPALAHIHSDVVGQWPFLSCRIELHVCDPLAALSRFTKREEPLVAPSYHVCVPIEQCSLKWLASLLNPCDHDFEEQILAVRKALGPLELAGEERACVVLDPCSHAQCSRCPGQLEHLEHAGPRTLHLKRMWRLVSS